MVFAVHRLGGLGHLAAQVGEDAEIAVAAIAEDAVLYLAVAVVGVIVQSFEVMLRHVVILDVVLEHLLVLLHVVAYVHGECKTHVAVCLRLGA